MKNTINRHFLVVSALILVFITACVPLGGVRPVESVRMEFDKREWRIGYSSERDGQVITEFILPGESVNNWTELVTIQTYPGTQARMTVKQLVQAIKKTTLNGCSTAMWNIIQEGRNEVLYEWQSTNCPGWDNQYEVAKAIEGKAALYVVRYTNKKLPISDKKKKEWNTLISSARTRSM